MKKLTVLILILLLGALPARCGEGRLVSLGDSLARGYGLENRDAERYSALIAQALGLEEVNLGVNGQTAPETLALVRELADDIRGVRAILLSIGANHAIPVILDPTQNAEAAMARFEEDLTALLSALEDIAPFKTTVVLLTFCPPDPDSPRCLAVCGALNDILRSCGEEFGCLVAETGEALSGETDVFLPDGIHPNARGHQIIADCILALLADRP